MIFRTYKDRNRSSSKPINKVERTVSNKRTQKSLFHNLSELRLENIRWINLLCMQHKEMEEINKNKNHVEKCECDICHKLFSKKLHLNRHIRHIHLGVRPYSCDICGKKYYQRSNLKRHLLVHAGIKPFECHLCESSFTEKYYLKQHILQHQTEENIVCDKCRKSFFSKNSFTRHTCSAKQYFLCHICKEVHTSKTSLEEHIQSHNEELTKNDADLSTKQINIPTKKKFICQECGKEFSKNSVFNEHMRIHKGEKPFECEICHRKYARKNSLKFHQQTHGEKRFFCDKCRKGFVRKSCFVAHIRLHRNILSNESSLESLQTVLE